MSDVGSKAGYMLPLLLRTELVSRGRPETQNVPTSLSDKELSDNFMIISLFYEYQSYSIK